MPHQRLEPASVLRLAFQSLPTELFPAPARHNYSNSVGPKRQTVVVRGHETFIRTACPQNRQSWRGSMNAATDQALVLTPGFRSKKRFFTVSFNHAGPLVVDTELGEAQTSARKALFQSRSRRQCTALSLGRHRIEPGTPPPSHPPAA